jgi:ribonuclease BN (tRNA processing enzyme)
VRLAILGVRGSTPAPGAAFVRYGGHTSCIAVLADADDVPHLVLDAGTGVRSLPDLLGGRPFDGAIVLSHLHWDHVQGLPFCPSLDHPEARVDLWVPAIGGDRGDPTPHGGRETARDVLARAMSPPHFPIEPEGLLGSWRFLLADPGELPVGPRAGAARVRVASVEHKGGETYVIRVDLDGASIAYLPDHNRPVFRHSPVAGTELIHGVDVLLHDGQFVDGEETTALAYGHSTIEDAAWLADLCHVGRLVVIHHAPGRTDDQLDALAARFTETPGGRPTSFARQGDVLPVRAVSRASGASADGVTVDPAAGHPSM